MTHHQHNLAETAAAMVAPGKGILAADESTGTMSKRLEKEGIEVSAENRRAYRDLLVTTPNLGEWISGVIMFDETVRSNVADGRPFMKAVAEGGMLPGIKVDTGAKPLAGSPDEKVTEGLDGLRERLAEYVEMGARFAKWRAVIQISDHMPTRQCISANAHALARYAALCQEAGVVPIVEPEVLTDGDHTLKRCAQVSADTLAAVFAELRLQKVALDGMVLKPNMVLPGKDGPQASVDEVVDATLATFKEVVPAAVPGIAFLSGGQGDELASEHLNAFNQRGPQPWALTFSYGRALVQAALSAWAGKEDNVRAGQQQLAHRARCNAAAREGEYTPEMEKELAPA